MTYVEGYAGKSVWENEVVKSDIDKLFLEFEIIEINTSLAEKAGQLRAIYNLSTMDAIIAATALEHNLQLATLNVKDFEKIPNLELFKIDQI